MNESLKELANSSSTGGQGIHFENLIQASFVVLMLANGFSPCLPSWPIQKIKLQGKYQGFETDDLIVYVKQPNTKRQAKLLGQIKHSISVTKGDKDFNEMIRAAWNDFNNSEIFSEGVDAIALICGPLSKTDTDDVHLLLRQARHSESADDFIDRIELANFTSNNQRKKFEVFKTVLKSANRDKELSNEQLWIFLKSFHLLIYDLDIEGIILSLLKTIIEQQACSNVDGIWSQIFYDVARRSENAGFITRTSVSDEIKSLFTRKPREIISNNFVRGIPIQEINWNNSTYGTDLSYLTLIGLWDEQSKSDVDIAKNIVGEFYNDWIRKLRDILQLEKSPISINNGVWKIKEHGIMWENLSPRFFDNMLDSFQKATVMVLKEKDPKFDLSNEDRYAAGIYGKVLNYSTSLRKGLAQSLALIGCQPEKLTSCSARKAENTALLCVREIFEEADWILWASLSDLLPILAEASPDSFIDAVESALNGTINPFTKIFEQEGTGITGWNYLTGLLWALEGLAWDEQLIVRVTVILGELANLDPGGNWANRPINSLIAIFLPWYPQTKASFQKRMTAIEVLTKENPKISWDLLMSLLPNNQQTTSGSHKPSYRNPILEDWKPTVTNKEYWEQVATYAEYVVELAKGDILRLQKLIISLADLPEKAFDLALLYLQSDDVKAADTEEKLLLWTELLSFIRKHERFLDAKWAMSIDALSRLKAVSKILEPQNPIDYYRFLFCESDWDLYEHNDDQEAESKRLEERRQHAIRVIIDFGGHDAVFQFVNYVEAPNKVGATLGAFADK